MSNGNLSFRRISEGDLKIIRAWRNSPDVARHMYTDHQISEAEHRAWFAKMRSCLDASYWIVEYDGRPVGLANVVEINFDHRSAAWAFYLAEAQVRGKGVGLYVEYCVLACVFDYWELETLRCEVLETNADVCALHKSVGFAETGRLSRRTTKGEMSVDAIAFAMTKYDWNSTYRARLEGRIRARGRNPSPLLSAIESTEADEEAFATFFGKIDSEIDRASDERKIR